MGKLTDRQRKRVIAEYVQGGTSHRKLARKYGVSEHCIRTALSDKDIAQKIARKKKANTASVLAFMDSRTEDVCKLIGKLLDAIGDDEKLAVATVNQLATAMGIVIDKFTAGRGLAGERENNLFDAIVQGTEGVLDTDEIPEVEQAATAGADVVEPPGIQEP